MVLIKRGMVLSVSGAHPLADQSLKTGGSSAMQAISRTYHPPQKPNFI